jgi:hypothetical protein
MTWNNMPHHHIKKSFSFQIMESQIAFLSQHAMTKLHVMKKIKLFLFDLLNKFFSCDSP